MKLYEISTEFAVLFDDLDGISAWEPTVVDGIAVDENGEVIENITAHKEKMIADLLNRLMDIEADFEVKAENIACFIKELTGETETLKKEKKSISARLDAKAHLVERLKTMLVENMTAIGRKTIDRPKARISLRNNQETAQFVHEKEFISWANMNRPDLLKYTPEINRTAVKTALQNGDKIQGAVLGRTVSAIIK